jgi:hypothetical protein
MDDVVDRGGERSAEGKQDGVSVLTIDDLPLRSTRA